MNKLNSYKRIWAQFCSRPLLILSAVLYSTVVSFAQLESSDTPAQINNDPRLEEIQRYMGYEDLFFRYTTMPYDLTMNTNESASFLDIGFLHLIFLPLILIFVVIKNRKVQYVGIVILILYLFSCFYFSKVFVGSQGHFVAKEEILKGYQWDWNNGIMGGITYHIHKSGIGFFDTLYNSGILNISSLNIITYLFIILTFIASLFFLQRIKRKRTKSVVAIFLGFSLLFFILSSGIVWYGFLLVPLSLYLILLSLERNKDNPIYKTLKISFGALSVLTIASCILLRMSNIQQGDADPDKGINLLFPNIYSYSIGHSSEKETLDMVFPNLSAAMDEINNTDDLIYKIGTSFTIHIDDNHERVVADNQLSIFYQMFQKYGGGKNIYKVLKEYGFGYVILDLHTSSIDKTPTKSLTQKYQVFLESIYNNPDLTLVNTDRILEVQNQNGQISNIYGIFGQIKYFGNYAVFKIN